MSVVVLPSTVEELNYMQSTQSMYTKSENNKGFENIQTIEYKREISLPDGVNWNLFDYESYLTFEDDTPRNNFKAIESHDDCIVPGEGEIRQRVESFSSVASSMEDKSLVFHSSGVKTFNTVCMDSGSTCISSEHSYVSPSPPVYKELDSEETYQNLSRYFKQGPEIHPADSLSSISPASSPANDNSNLEYSVLNNFSMIGNCSQDGFSEISVGSKRLADTSDDDLFLMTKRRCESPDGNRYHEIRKKNNIASKNCRKTRKEKQKEMELRVAELEKEREQLNASIDMLEKLINTHRVHLCTILGNRQASV